MYKRQGNIVYSVFKELDYATSLKSGPYRDSNFAKAFKLANEIENQSDYAIVDFEKYAPSYNAPASFIAVPIWDGDNKIGVLVFQMPIDRINSIMKERSGLGETGESYLVGSDKLMRSDSFVDNENFNVVSSFQKNNKAESKTLDLALKGKSGSEIIQSYTGKEVVSTYTPIKILGMDWALMAEIETKEAFASIEQMKQVFYILLISSVTLITLFALFLASSLAKKISTIGSRLLESAKKVAQSSHSISESSGELNEASTEQAASLQETVSSIDEINSMVRKNADAANRSAEISKKSNETGHVGKKRVSAMVDSMKEISTSNDEIESIEKVISEISNKTKVINDIVFQTKLLSINASVEAAKAGEHGKGFAVVAEEVGNLAAISGKASLEITELIQNSTNRVNEIVKSTNDKISRGEKNVEECGDALDNILNDASAVNEMVREIAIASAEQSTGVQEVTKAMQQLDQTMLRNTSVANQSAEMATELNSQADQLNSAVVDLMGLVSGEKVSHTSSQGTANNNVVQLHSKKSEIKHEQPMKKVSGESTTVSDDFDARFEDL